MNTYVDSRMIELNSSDAIKLNGTYNSNVIFPFQGILMDEPDIIKVDIELINTQIPISWYVINENNNVLNYTINGVSKTITLPVGNYTGSDIIIELQTLFSGNGNTITIAPNVLQGKLIFTATTDFTFYKLGSTALNALGFTEDSSSVSNVLNAPYPLNLLTVNSIHIDSTALSSYSYSSRTNGLSEMIATISVDKSPFGIINYNSSHNLSRLLRNKVINSIDIQLKDQEENLVDFNNTEWSLTLAINILRILPVYSRIGFSEILRNMNVSNINGEVQQPPIEIITNKPEEIKEEIKPLKIIEKINNSDPILEFLQL